MVYNVIQEAAKNKQKPIRVTFTNLVISSGVVLVPCAVAGHMFAQRFHFRPMPLPFKSVSLGIIAGTTML